MKASKFYVYELIDPRDGRVFYVGKGTRHNGRNATRLGEHIKETKEYIRGERGRTHKLLKIRKIMNARLKPVFSIIFNTDIETETAEVEQALIAINYQPRKLIGFAGTTLREAKIITYMHWPKHVE